MHGRLEGASESSLSAGHCSWTATPSASILQVFNSTGRKQILQKNGLVLSDLSSLAALLFASVFPLIQDFSDFVCQILCVERLLNQRDVSFRKKLMLD